MKICPMCNKNRKEFIDNLCKDCYIKNNGLVIGFKDIKIEQCVNCHEFRYQKRYVPHIDNIIKKHIVFNKNAKIEKIESKLEDKEVNIVITGNILGKKITEEYDVPVKIQGLTCSRCGKKGTQYFEGILQIRATNKEILFTVIDYIEANLKIVAKKGIYANKKVQQKNGVDFWLTNKTYVSALAQRIYEKYGMEIKVNAQHFSRNKMTSKDIFRVNAVVKLPDFVKGDVIEIDNQLLKVINCKGQLLTAYDIDKEKNIKLSMKNAEYKIIGTKDDYYETEVIGTQPTITILHPKTYQSVKINTKLKLKTGDIVKILLINDKVYLD